MGDGEMRVEVSGEGDFSMESECAWMVQAHVPGEGVRVWPSGDGLEVEVNGVVVHPPAAPSHRLVVIGGIADSRAYLDVDTEVAILRYLASAGIEVRHGTDPRDTLSAHADVYEFTFSDEFWTYSSMSLEDAHA